MQGRKPLAAALLALLVLMRGVPIHAEKNSTELYKEGMAYAAAGRLDLAEAAFIKTINVNPWYCLGHYGLGRVYLYKQETMERALLHLSKCVELDPNFAPGYFYLGMAQMLSKKYPDAIHSFDSAYTRDNRFVEALYNMGTIYDLLGESYKAFYYYRKYLEEKNKIENKPF